MAIEKWDIDYNFLKDAYRGTGGFLDGSYLVRFPKESDEKYINRKKLAINPNVVKKVVNSISGHIFKTAPVRKIESKFYEQFCENTDRKGTYIDEKMKQILIQTMIYGTLFIVVDKPRIEAQTKLDEIRNGIFPYIAIRKPSHLHSYETDEYGNLEFIQFKETVKDNKVFYRTFTKDSWYLSQDDQLKSIIDSGQHKLGVVPVIPFVLQDIDDEELLEPPFILEIAYMQKDLYNAISELRSILRDNTFPVLTYPIKDETEAQKLQNTEVLLSTQNGLFYNPEAGAKPEYIAPPSTPADQLLNYVDWLIRQIFKQVNLDFSGSNESGISKEYDYQEFTKMLANFSQALENLEYKIANLIGLWLGEEFNGYIEYNKKYTIMDAKETVQMVLEVLDRPDIPPILQNEIWKKITRTIFNDTYDEKELQALESAIDSREDWEIKMRSEEVL